jgi:hypothetical protein
VRLPTALQLYWKAHKKSGDAAFVAKVNRDWDKLVNALGEVAVMSLNRSQARQFVDACLAEGLKTTSVRRSINHINAVLNVAIREAELAKQNPFSNLPIAGEGKDSMETPVATQEQLEEIAKEVAANADSEVALITDDVVPLSGISLLSEPRYRLVRDTEVAAVQICSRPNESTHCSVRRLRQAPTASNAELNVALGRITAFTLASSAL